MKKYILFSLFISLLAFNARSYAIFHSLFANNPGVIAFAHPEQFTKVYAISDTHGMYAELTKLLQAAQIVDSSLNWSAGKSLLLIVGDSIDKGPQSVETLDLWLRLMAQASAANGAVVHLLGNHEAEFLADPTNDKTADLLHELQSKNIPVTNLTDPSTPRGALLNGAPLAAKVGAWLFCHAGLYPTDMSWADFSNRASSLLNARSYGDAFITGDNSILESKDWWKDSSARQSLENTLTQNGFFGLVQGHQPSAYNINNNIGAIDGGRLIKIDNGMAPDAGSNPGRVLVFNHPQEMNLLQLPSISVINDDGSTQALQPQTYLDLPSTP